VSEFSEETIKKRSTAPDKAPFDLRAANAIGFLAGILLKALHQRPGRISAEAKAAVISQLYAKRLYLPDWRKEAIEKIQRNEREASGTEVTIEGDPRQK